PMNPAVVLENVEHRVSGGEILPSHIGGIDLQRLALSQHEQSSCVIDLGIDQHYPAYCCIAQGSSWLQFWKRAELRKYIRGSIEENPVGAIVRDRYRRLSSWPCPDRPAAQAVTVGTITIPLRKAATGR